MGALRKVLILGVFLPILVLNSARANEQLGEMKISDFNLAPTYLFSERTLATSGIGRGFGLGDSFLGVQWRLNRQLSSRFQFADTEQVRAPSWSTSGPSGFGWVEAYAQLEGLLGTVRAGLVPLQFGWDGSLTEGRRWFPRTQLYAQRLIGLRDYGITYSISHENFFTDVAVHNGEGGEDRDHRYWQTARWGYRGAAGTVIGLSGVVGYYNTMETNAATPTTDVKTRAGNFFFAMDLYGLGLAAEGTLGERKSVSTQLQFLDWYFALRHSLGKNWGLLMRYEFYDPSNRIRDDAEKLGLIGTYIQNETDTSRLMVTFTKNWEEGETVADDEYRVVWRLTSAYLQ